MAAKLHDQRRFPRTCARPKRPARAYPPAGRATFDLALRMGGLFARHRRRRASDARAQAQFVNLDVGISVLRAMSSVAIMSLGLTLVIVVGEIDLSFGAMYGLGANSLAVMWICAGRSDLCRAAADARRRRAGRAVQRRLSSPGCSIPSFIVTLGSYNLLYGVSLWISKTSTFNPDYPPPGVEICRRPARFLHRPDGELRLASDLARSRLDARPRAGRRVPAAPHAVRLSPDGDRRQSGRGPARPAAGARATRSSPS